MTPPATAALRFGCLSHFPGANVNFENDTGWYMYGYIERYVSLFCAAPLCIYLHILYVVPFRFDCYDHRTPRDNKNALMRCNEIIESSSTTLVKRAILKGWGKSNGAIHKAPRSSMA